MKQLTIIFLSVLFFSLSSVKAQKSYSETGIFLDTLKVGGMQLRISITVSKNDQGNFTATFNSIDQGSGEIAFDEVIATGNHMLFKSKIGIEIEGDYNAEKTKIVGELRQGPGKFPMSYARVDKVPVNKRQQEPQKPYPYREEEVVYKNEKAGIQLAGTLTLPKGEGPFKAVVLLTGSGPQNRNEEVFGHKPFLVLADYLTRNGIAVLRVDDRAVGGSTGDFSNSTSGDFAEDALAGISYLKTRKEINPKMIGFIGHSEGGMIAPIAASESDQVAFIVMMAGPGSNLGDNVVYQRNLLAKNTGASDAYIQAQDKVLKDINSIAKKNIPADSVKLQIRKMYAGLDAQTKANLNWDDNRLEAAANTVLGKWMRYGIQYDPESTLKSVHCPILALLGEKDQQVPAALNQKELERATADGNAKNKVVVLPGLNHLFQTCTTGDELEYSKIEETMSPSVMELMAKWVLAL
jgi:pimeloyl-ACP methyl ester carboxylesterase